MFQNPNVHVNRLISEDSVCKTLVYLEMISTMAISKGSIKTQEKGQGMLEKRFAYFTKYLSMDHFQGGGVLKLFVCCRLSWSSYQ